MKIYINSDLKKGKNITQYLINSEGTIYSAPANFTYMWSFGSMALYCLVVQLLTGIFLAMHYKSGTEMAYMSVIYIMMEVEYGWMLRYTHLNCASLFFVVVYIHIFKGLIMSSYNQPRNFLWFSGVVIFFLLIITAFLGYVLPWGQMSYWAATVITSFVTAIPVKGVDILEWIWGGFSVSDATLVRFFSLHYFLPFVILGLSIYHILLLHEYGSTNPIGVSNKLDEIKMYPYYFVKDLFAILLLNNILVYLVFFNPDVLNHPDNYILANSVVTPAHIVPEWYFLGFYALLRVLPDKLGGVTVLLMAIVFLFFLPIFVNGVMKVRAGIFKPYYKALAIFFAFVWVFLTWIGGQVVEAPYFVIGQNLTYAYFLIYFVIVFVSKVEFEYLEYFEKWNKLENKNG